MSQGTKSNEGDGGAAVRAPTPPPPPLTHFVRGGDRADGGRREAFFVGRCPELLAVDHELLLLDEGFVGGRAVVFQGAPGAGKSALLHEATAMAAMRSKPGDEWVPVRPSPEMLAHPEDLVALILSSVLAEREVLATLSGPRSQAQESGRRRLGGFWRAVMARGGGVAGARIGAARAPTSAQGWFASIAHDVGTAKVVVLVDEAQNVPDGSNGSLDLMARGETGLRLMPMFFGLSNSADMLEMRGLSRPPDSAIRDLKPLAADEARSAFGLMLDAYGARGQGKERWIDALASLSQGWPQHINRIGAEALSVLEAHGMEIDGAPLDAALQKGTAAKLRHYESRLRGLSGTERRIAASVAQRIHGGGAIPDAEVCRLAAADGLKGQERQQALLDKFVKRGILAPVGSGQFAIPIPSLRDHLADAPPRSRPPVDSPAP